MNLSTHHPPAERCPTPERLRALALGHIEEDGREELAAHLESCPQCRTIVEELEVAAQDATASTYDKFATQPGEEGCEGSPLEDAAIKPYAPAVPAPQEAHTDDYAGTTREGGRFHVFRELPTQFGRYEIRRCLGRGGMGEVYLAWDTQLGRLVALKVPTGDSRHSSLRRFLREARAAAALDHPSICPIYDHGEIDGVYYLTLKYIEGRTLAETLKDGPLPIPEAIELCRKLAEALDAAHRAGVVHRDLKPSNIMPDAAGQPHVMDFGLAHRETDEALLTRSGDILGTPAYMSPEQARGDNEQVDSRSDLYSLGAVLYQSLTGRMPFTGNFTQVLTKVLHDDPPPPSRHRPEIAPGLDALCRKAMAKTPADRYPTAQDFAAALEQALATDQAAPPIPEPNPAPTLATIARSPSHVLLQLLPGRRVPAPTLTAVTSSLRPAFSCSLQILRIAVTVTAVVFLGAFVLWKIPRKPDHPDGRLPPSQVQQSREKARESYSSGKWEEALDACQRLIESQTERNLSPDVLTIRRQSLKNFLFGAEGT